MSDRPYFSIGVTTFDRRELLVETVASILAQSFGDFEVIVGNDNPAQSLTLQSLGIDDQRVRILNHVANLGEIGNMNELLAQSRGRYFTWLADDDLYAPDFLQAVRDAHERFGPVSCVFSSYVSGVTWEPGRVAYEQNMLLLSGRDFLCDYLARKIQTLGCCGVFDIQYLRQEGGIVRLGSGFSPYSDNLLAIEAGALDRVCYIAAPLLFFRTHPDSISFSSPDVNAYFTAQEDLCARALAVFRLPQLRSNLQQNLYQLLGHWCMTFMFHVMRRPRNRPSVSTLITYLRFVQRNAGELDARHRIRLAFAALNLVLRHCLFVLVWHRSPR
jgi:glycosyltransferase involved in cell wall biosynthesis